MRDAVRDENMNSPIGLEVPDADAELLWVAQGPCSGSHTLTWLPSSGKVLVRKLATPCRSSCPGLSPGLHTSPASQLAREECLTATPCVPFKFAFSLTSSAQYMVPPVT